MVIYLVVVVKEEMVGVYGHLPGEKEPFTSVVVVKEEMVGVYGHQPGKLMKSDCVRVQL